MDVDELTSDLEAAGLDPKQAEVYVRLLQSGPSKVQQLVPYVDASRSTVYRLLDELAEVGVVEKSLDNPVVYEAIPPDDLFERGRAQLKSSMARLETVRERWAETLESIAETDAESEPHHWSKIQGNARIYERLRHMIEEADETFEVASNHEATTSPTLPAVEETWKVFARKVADRSLECRLLVDLDRTTFGDFLDRATEFEGVELRDFSAENTVSFVLVDGREVLMWVYPAPLGGMGTREDVAVWTNAPGSVFAHRMLFERIWPEGEPVGPGT